jgi:hypothetical protein
VRVAVSTLTPLAQNPFAASSRPLSRLSTVSGANVRSTDDTNVQIRTGGQPFAPQTREKWIRGSKSDAVGLMHN